MELTKTRFGETGSGEAVYQYTLKENGGEVQILDYGCTLRSIRVPDRTGQAVDVCLGYDTVAEYESHDGYLGAVIGRHANRIQAGRFSLGGKEYHLACNDGPNHLHGGRRGFDKYVWQAEALPNGVCFRHTFPDGDEGYPGKLEVCVRYTWEEGRRLRLHYEAVSDQDTVLNMTNHCYFNLSGGGTIRGHELCLHASRFTENDDHCLPTGRILQVEGGVFDFRSPKTVGRDLDQPDQQLLRGKGYDHNFILDDPAPMKQAGWLRSPDTGIRMEVETTQPGIQLYTGNVLTDRTGKGGARYGKNGALCLETQHFPNSMAHPEFPSVVLPRGVQYCQETVYTFSVEK